MAFTDGTVTDMAVVATLVPNEKKRRRKWRLFVLIGIDWQPKTVYRCYRHRFAIKASYRILRRVVPIASPHSLPVSDLRFPTQTFYRKAL
ncbi:MAG: hypothetical protein WAU00_20040 [Caldilinea sp.]|uniref:hypothetical protein n=1 Tax=Caldilinea sp. TaxID=2293560 RepID=UPI002BCAFABE|nr:hypothetical protein [Anaerolineales bacterium]HQY92682.1 hypothetical protein [Caldilinea sp.]HRA67098.1 hypothetical protein [Caldilinea sp.]